MFHSTATADSSGALEAPVREFKLWIDGGWTDALDGETFVSINPGTGEAWASLAAAGPADAEVALQAARRAFDDGRWSGLSPTERSAVLANVATKIWDKSDDLAEAECADMGSTIRKTGVADLTSAAQAFEYFAELIAGAKDQVFTSDMPVPSTNIVTRHPYGVVVGIVPWNFPMAAASWKIAPAIAAGNTVVIKPSPLAGVTPLLIAEACSEAGVPPGVVNVVTGPEASLGEALVQSPLTDKITFTGSSAVGKRIHQMASPGLKPVTLELGGKAATLILDDADLDIAVDGSLFLVFFNQGQACISGSRILVPRHKHDAFVEKMKAGVEQIQYGATDDPLTTWGALISQEHWDRVDGYVKAAIADGATLLCGGGRPEQSPPTGFFYAPTILTQVTPEMTIANEEVFGPVATVIPYDTEEEAIAITNAVPYGLSNAIWSADTERATAVARRLQSGTVWINDGLLLNNRFPFAGWKDSGVGVELGPWGLEQFTKLQHIHVGEHTGRDEKYYVAIVLGDED
jgi:aldehyde dehydrogenase (NAD+)